MSVTSILSYYNKEYKDFRTLLSQQVGTPDLTKQFNLVRYNYMNTQSQIKKGEKPTLLAPCYSRNYLIIGSAYDYYLRFSIQKNYKNIISRRLIAEMALETLKNIVANHPFYIKYERALGEIEDCYNESKGIISNFINGDAQDSDKILATCIFFAKLDLLYRGGANPYETLLFATLAEKDDIKDLKGIINVASVKYFKPQRIAVLNPTFGKASIMIGGADADIIIDNKLIDIKVTKGFKLLRPNLNQLLIYYLLYLIGGIDSVEDLEIDELGVFFPRFNFLWTSKINQLAKPDQFKKMKTYLEKKIKNR